MHVSTLCDWFSYSVSASASASDSNNLVSLDHKRNVSDGVVSGIETLFSLDRKLYASSYDSDSVASENQPLSLCRLLAYLLSEPLGSASVKTTSTKNNCVKHRKHYDQPLLQLPKIISKLTPYRKQCAEPI